MKFPYSCTTRTYAATLSVALTGCAISVSSAIYAANNDTAITTLQFRNNVIHQRVLELRDDVAIAEDDMIVGYADEFFGHQRFARGLGNSVYGKTWPNGVVPFQFGDDLSAAGEAKVMSAINHWNENSTILLVPRTSQNASQYPNYLKFITASQCASWVGFQSKGPQDVYVGNNCTTGSMIHEIGHSLGLLHEHTRPDRDAFVQINWDNVQDGKEHNFDVLSDGAVRLGDYDYGSIMHYGTHFFSKNNEATLQTIRSTSASIGQRIATSQGDRQAIAKLYETDLSISMNGPQSQVAAGTAVELNFMVTNNASNGANTLAISLPVYSDMELLGSNAAMWDCQQPRIGADVVCTSELLQAGSSATIALTVNATHTTNQMTLSPLLSSRTQDSTTINNTDSYQLNIASSGTVMDQSPTTTPEPVREIANTPVIVSGTQTGANPTTPFAATSTDADTTQFPTVALSVLPTTINQSTEPQIGAAQSGGDSGGEAGGGSLGISVLSFSLLLGWRKRLDRARS